MKKRYRYCCTFEHCCDLHLFHFIPFPEPHISQKIENAIERDARGRTGYHHFRISQFHHQRNNE